MAVPWLEQGEPSGPSGTRVKLAQGKQPEAPEREMERDGQVMQVALPTLAAYEEERQSVQRGGSVPLLESG